MSRSEFRGKFRENLCTDQTRLQLSVTDWIYFKTCESDILCLNPHASRHGTLRRCGDPCTLLLLTDRSDPSHPRTGAPVPSRSLP